MLEEFGMDSFWLGDLEGYVGVVQFGPPRMGVPSDFRHRKPPAPRQRLEPEYCGPRSDYPGQQTRILSDRFRLAAPPPSANWSRIKTAPYSAPPICSSNTPEVHYLSVDQGYFDENGNFVTVLRRNGGHMDWGLWVEGDIGVVRV